MQRASHCLGAGRTPTGSTPYLVSKSHAYFSLRAPRKCTFGLNSNRHLVRLECDVTSTKQTKGVRSNRQKIGARGIACRAGCSPTTAVVSPEQSQRPTKARTAANAIVVTPPEPRTLELQQGILPRQRRAGAAGYSAPVRLISNRNSKRLEIAVTHSKHSPDLISNRNKNSLARDHFRSVQAKRATSR
jgi:hypothetical protein